MSAFTPTATEQRMRRDVGFGSNATCAEDLVVANALSSECFI